MIEKSLVKKERLNIYQKIKLFLQRIFYKGSYVENINISKKNKNQNILDKLKKENKLKRLQENYENGIIRKDELSEKEKEELLLLYKKQIANLRENINNYQIILESYKTKIINIRRRKNI